MIDLWLLAETAFQDSPIAAAEVLNSALKSTPDNEILHLIHENLSGAWHLIRQCQTLDDVLIMFHSRLQHIDLLSTEIDALEAKLPKLRLSLWRELPDLPLPVENNELFMEYSAISGDGTMLATICKYQHGAASIWDVESGKIRYTLSNQLRSKPCGCAINKNGSLILIPSVGKKLSAWNGINGTALTPFIEDSDGILGCDISGDGHVIVTSNDAKTAKVWNAKDGSLLHVLTGHRGVIHDFALNHTGSKIVTASADGSTIVWDGATGNLLHKLSGHGRRVLSCSMNSNEDTIVTASADGTVKVWDGETGDLLYNLTEQGPRITSCVITQNGEVIITTSVNGAIKVWETSTGKCLSTLMVVGSLYDSTILPDGKRVIVVGDNGIYWLKMVL